MDEQAVGSITLPITGMTCGGCAAGLQRALTRAPGVRQAVVSFSTADARVEYDPARTNPQALTAVVAAAGFEARPVS